LKKLINLSTKFSKPKNIERIFFSKREFLLEFQAKNQRIEIIPPKPILFEIPALEGEGLIFSGYFHA
jgi:hypothetical protein